jgi:hypothetical protein
MAGESRLTEAFHESRVFKVRCRKCEKRPNREPVTREQDMIIPIVQATSLAGSLDGDAKQAVMASWSFVFRMAVR